MPADLAELLNDPGKFIGIPIALVGAVFLALGAQFQHRGVAKVERFSKRSSSAGLSGGQLVALLSRPSWVVGTLLLGLAIVFQLTSLGFAPLIVVQPLGAVALVITTVVNARVSHVRLNAASIRAVVLCVGGVGTFVLVAAFNAVDKSIKTPELVTILVILAVVLTVFVIAFRVFRRGAKAIFYIVGAGVVYGFVATLAKVVLNRIKYGEFDPLTTVCIVALIAATALGGYFVQNAYSSGPPDLVVAGLTVIDPLVAVAIGIIVLGEAEYAAPWAVPLFVVAGGVAISGVFLLAKHHPQAR
ncbi:multidrug DMT transporter permease [Rathayibacter rathayi]|uniref:Multidrug DMT transporter permease n=1 Tax=Rathayibacter rathayi TaxID=33887 RepID=A0ABD6WAK6_RATRA|nr:DMT family transporter [Rathayibacter rathayi]AZZ49002.1 multidrug DMT transporter permease [Rathayibacter rathayi]MWV74109.1 multidrug DMT transporter permease [Rathayibacter rathayi NCPPB 2980 = VKM Ac-1601]PPF15136.1 multidrug DMT transporter permease [Rathayibacter rathayi]PPF25055.1 multidrug DMT transporter permease [Rathayibacter rathayi]PPF51179.1 multidrug DMT transporter permease [Rathayibacter rathayi]